MDKEDIDRSKPALMTEEERWKGRLKDFMSDVRVVVAARFAIFMLGYVVFCAYLVPYLSSWSPPPQNPEQTCEDDPRSTSGEYHISPSRVQKHGSSLEPKAHPELWELFYPGDPEWFYRCDEIDPSGRSVSWLSRSETCDGGTWDGVRVRPSNP